MAAAAPADAEKLWEKIKVKIATLKGIPRIDIKARKHLANEILIEIESPMLRGYLRSDSTLFDEYISLSSEFRQYAQARLESLNLATKAHFERVFSENGKIIQDMNFFGKTGGDQLGQKVVINYKNPESVDAVVGVASSSSAAAASGGGSGGASGGAGAAARSVSLSAAEAGVHTISYFIKTHQFGSKSSASAIGSVDLKELFIYKLLEYTGFGPKVDFFFGSPPTESGLYIATQDAAFSKDATKAKSFVLYEALKDNFERERSVGGMIDKEAQAGICATDILSRIFCLQDVATNSTNFGRVSKSDGTSKWKIIDFRVETRAGAYIIPGIFEGFSFGNGMFNYSHFLGYLLRDRPEVDRIKTGMQVMQELEIGRPHQSKKGFKMPLMQAMNSAFCEVVRFAASHQRELGIVDIKRAMGDFIKLADKDDGEILSYLDGLVLTTPDSCEKLGDFGKYIKAARENYTALLSGIRERFAVLNPEASAAAASC